MKKVISIILSIITVVSVASFVTVSASAATKPSKPSEIYVLKESSTSSKIYWCKVSGATGYQLLRSTSKNKGFKVVTTTSKTFYVNKKLSSKSTYYYKVRAYKKSGSKKLYSSYSAVKSVNMKTALEKALNGKYELFYDRDDITFDGKTYKVKARVFDPVVVTRATANNYKTGTTFTVKYKSAANVTRTEKYRVRAVDKTENGGKSLLLAPVSATEYNSKTNKTKKSQCWASVLYQPTASADYQLSEMSGCVNDYASKKDVILYIKDSQTFDLYDYGICNFTNFLQLNEPRDKNNYLYVNVKSNYVVYMDYVLG